MKLKLDANGNVVVQDGRPVYVDDHGNDIAFDVVGTIGKIKQLSNEARQNRERAESAEGKLNVVKEKGIDIEKLDDVVSALNTVKNLNDKKLIDAGQVDQLKAQMRGEFDKQLKVANDERDAARSELVTFRIGNAFIGSKFIGEKMNVPADVARAYFGNSFKIEDGKLVGYDKFQQKIMSKANPGELAEFDEALGQLVEADPNGKALLKPTQGSGGGGSSKTPAGGSNGAKVTTRDKFNSWSPAEQSKFSLDGGTIQD